MTFRFKSLQQQYALGVQYETPTEPLPMFSLFKMVNKRWVRINTQAYRAPFAVKVWGDKVVVNPYTYSIREVDIHPPKVRNKYHVAGKLIG